MKTIVAFSATVFFIFLLSQTATQSYDHLSTIVKNYSRGIEPKQEITYRCSNHDPAHVAKRNELHELTRKFGCTGWHAVKE